MLESLNKFQFILAALNLIILYIVLKKILFKPITNFMENRSKAIQDSIDSADKQIEEAGELKLMYELQLKQAKTESETIVNEATVKANRMSDELLREARQGAEFIQSNARKEIEHERAQMLQEVRGEVATLALAAASKVLEANMDTASNRVLVDKFLDEAGVA